MSPTSPERIGAAQAAAVLAVGAAAVSLVAGLGTYLYIRFTQNRGKKPAGAGTPAKQPPAAADEGG